MLTFSPVKDLFGKHEFGTQCHPSDTTINWGNPKFNHSFGTGTEVFRSLKPASLISAWYISFLTLKFSLLLKWFLQSSRGYWCYQIRTWVTLNNSAIMKDNIFSKDCFKQKSKWPGTILWRRELFLDCYDHRYYDRYSEYLNTIQCYYWKTFSPWFYFTTMTK